MLEHLHLHTGFQFLIGRLGTQKSGAGGEEKERFQFLIGRLGTCGPFESYRYANEVSIPHR